MHLVKIVALRLSDDIFCELLLVSEYATGLWCFLGLSADEKQNSGFCHFPHFVNTYMWLWQNPLYDIAVIVSGNDFSVLLFKQALLC